jgi:hypothetical protein
MTKLIASDRTFGILLCAGVAAASYYAFSKVNVAFAQALTLLCAVMIVMVICCPNKFRRLKLAWLWLGDQLGTIVSPITLALIYFIVLTPTALISRALGRDPLRLKNRSCSTYWIPRSPLDRTQSDFFNQQY